MTSIPAAPPVSAAVPRRTAVPEAPPGSRPPASRPPAAVAPAFIGRHPVLTFYAFAFAVSWSGGLLAVGGPAAWAAAMWAAVAAIAVAGGERLGAPATTQGPAASA